MSAEAPLVFMSTTSSLKHTALATAMERAGMMVRVDGAKVESRVNEQPMTFDETYEGAMNRHRALKELGIAAAYYATVESGLHQVHKDQGVYGCSVVIVEPADGEARVGFALDVEFPQVMLDKVPAVYPDLGVLVQQEYDATEKDPFPYFTNGRLTRQETIENAVYNVAIQLERREA